MNKIECKQIGEVAYLEKLENGLQIIVIPEKNINKKYVIFGTHFGSIDNRFIMPQTGEEVIIPDGVAHFLEHKMFEQENGEDALYSMMALGLDANAYTTTDHTAYLFECNDNFYEGLDILMDYVQNPYFTNENVEKEKGIIGQEIMMYDDDPGWQLYMGTMDCLYKENPIKIDIAGSIESISKITPEILTKCYKTFYNLSNMTIVVCGNFGPEKIINEIKNRLVKTDKQGEIKRIYPISDSKINKNYTEKNMPISMPIFMIGYKDQVINNKKEAVRRSIASDIIMSLIVGESSDLYSELYNSGLILGTIDSSYEFSDQYAHAIFSGQSSNPKEVYKRIKEKIDETINQGISESDFNRIKKKLYGSYVSMYNEVSTIAKNFLSDSIKGINSFDFISEFDKVDIEYAKKILEAEFKDENSVLSVIKEK